MSNIKYKYNDKLIALIYSLGLFGFPLVSSIPMIFNIESRPVSIAVRAIVLVMAIYVLLPIKKTILTNKVFLLFASFWLLYSFRIFYTFFNEGQIVNFWGNFDFFSFAYGASLIPATALFFGLQNRKWSPASIYKYTYYVLLLATTVSLYLSLKQGVLLEQDTVNRLSTNILNAISLGHIGASLSILSLFSILFSRNVSSLIIINSIGLFIGVFTLLVSGSKGPMVAFLVVSLINLLYTVRLKKLLSIVIIVVTSGYLSGKILTFLKEKFNMSALERFDSLFKIFSGEDSSMSTGDASIDGRIGIWSDVLGQFFSSPIWGSGIVDKNTGYYPHNVLIEAFMSTGLLGGIIFLSLCFILIKQSLYLLRMKFELGWSGLIAIQYLIGSLFSSSLFGGYNMWVSMSLVFSVYIYYSKKDNKICR